jgi:hypothetical protein
MSRCHCRSASGPAWNATHSQTEDDVGPAESEDAEAEVRRRLFPVTLEAHTGSALLCAVSIRLGVCASNPMVGPVYVCGV